MMRQRLWLVLTFALATAHPAMAGVEAPGHTSAYVLTDAEELLQRFAPIFVVEHDEEGFNKIGAPSARVKARGKAEVYVDASHPMIYTEVETFETSRDRYTNLIYRVHFESSPFTLVPLNVSAAKNVGAIAVVTLNSREEPIWLTTVQSCGCYHAILPTDYLPEDAYPEDWNRESVEVYGEILPGLLRFKDAPTDARITITFRGGSHRCKDVAVRSETEIGGTLPLVKAAAAPVEALKHLPLPDGSETSFYHTEGRRRGLVKGAYKPLETVLFGLWAWDHNVGQDREYGPKEKAGRRFYTTLFFKRKKDSDMWHYANYLEHNGWKP